MKEIGVSGAQIEEIYALDADSLRAMRSVVPSPPSVFPPIGPTD